MILDLLIENQEKRPIWLHWGLVDETDVFWFDEFARLTEEYDNFTFDLTLEKAGKNWELCRGRVDRCLFEHHINNDFLKAGIYLCGNEVMVREIKQKLTDKGVSKESIHYEQFCKI